MWRIVQAVRVAGGHHTADNKSRLLGVRVQDSWEGDLLPALSV